LALWGDLWLPSAEAAASIPIDEEKQSQSQENLNANSLQAARAKMDKREKQLEERQVIAKEAESLASKRIEELTALETRIQDLLDQEKSINDKKIKRLTTVYEGMKADKAASVIAQMDMDIIVKMFSRMNEKQVGKILSFLPPKQAVVISEALTKRIGSL
jgi:flagellar motility protein MotE (MotC chaperone)